MECYEDQIDTVVVDRAALRIVLSHLHDEVGQEAMRNAVAHLVDAVDNQH